MIPSEDKIRVKIDSKYIYIKKSIFVDLFERSSFIHYYKDYERAKQSGEIKFSKLVELSRKGHIPYALFFAPEKLVSSNIKRDEDIIYSGIDRGGMYMAGRGNVDIKDIKLIVKDIRKRQMIMNKYHKNVPINAIININTSGGIEEVANRIVEALHINMEEVRAKADKTKAYECLVNQIEAANILVSKKQNGAMPQRVDSEVRFSGIALKDKHFPSIFLYSKDEDAVSDPVGRRIFTLILLLSCMAYKKYMPVSYDTDLRDIIESKEYIVAEEILVPRRCVEGISVRSIDDINNLAKDFKVTPSMMLMRLKRLGIIDKKDADAYFEELHEDRRLALASNKKIPYKIKDTTKFINYNGKKFTNDIFSFIENGTMSFNEARTILVSNRKTKDFLIDMKEAL
ncbi:hypothetical protein IJF91_02815 [Candidatus Saccharibacteria bacterium]|nr:hypothetical protein [Candidatus Saccharibacteria bacterium]